MKIARFSVAGGDPRYGILDSDDFVVLSGDPMFSGFDTTGERVPVTQAKLLAPVIPRSKVVSVALNYPGDPDGPGPSTPLVLLKPNTTVVGPDDAIRVPAGVGSVVPGGTLAIVIGSIAKRVRREDYASVVFGYTVGNDVTARDVALADGQWTRAKGYDTFAPIGPIIETELDWADLEITTRVDGQVRQQASTKDLIHGVAEIIEFVSDIWTLLPGDVVLTGAPAGAGELLAGQTVEVAIEGIGALSNPVAPR